MEEDCRRKASQLKRRWSRSSFAAELVTFTPVHDLAVHRVRGVPQAGQLPPDLVEGFPLLRAPVPVGRQLQLPQRAPRVRAQGREHALVRLDSPSPQTHDQEHGEDNDQEHGEDRGDPGHPVCAWVI